LVALELRPEQPLLPEESSADHSVWIHDMGIVGAVIANGAPIFSGPGLIFLIIILSNHKKGRRRR
jgi:hypothetical protein